MTKLRHSLLGLGYLLLVACGNDARPAANDGGLSDSGTVDAATTDAVTIDAIVDGGSQREVLADVVDIANTSAYAPALDGDAVAFFTDTALQLAPRNGSAEPTVLGTFPSEFSPAQLISDSTAFYAIGAVGFEHPTIRIYRFARSGGDAEAVAEVGGGSSYTSVGIANADASTLIFSNGFGGGVFRVAKSGGEPVQLATHASTGALVVRGSTLWYTAFEGAYKLFRRDVSDGAETASVETDSFVSELEQLVSTSSGLYALHNTLYEGLVSRIDPGTGSVTDTPILNTGGSLPLSFSALSDEVALVSMSNSRGTFIASMTTGAVLASDESLAMREIVGDENGLCWIAAGGVRCGHAN